MSAATLSDWAISSLLLSLRVAPVFAVAPPFSLARFPSLFRAFFGLGIAASLIAADPARNLISDHSAGVLIVAAARELMLGVLFVLAFQLVFAALYMAGRTIDIQAGFGLAALIDPTTRAQTPLIGTFFAYTAAILFFSMDGHIELLRVFALSLKAVPLGGWSMPDSITPLSLFIGSVFMSGLGMAGTAIVSLFLIDLIIAMLARTVPQMNALILGLQVKTLALLLVLPVCLGAGGAILVRMMRYTLEALPGLIA